MSGSGPESERGALHLDGVSKAYASVAAVRDLSLHVAPGSLTALLGPSGCGKTTTLGVVAGLVTPDTGDVRLAGRSLLRTPADRRPVSTVFQRPLLFPHLDVEANVGFGLRMRRTPRDVVRTRVHEMLDRVQLTGLGSRRVGELSGGQEQRVALARSLVLKPELLLLDEPFSQLDASLRSEMRQLVVALHRDTGLTTVFVTHDQGEAVEVADEIALMLDGRLEGQGAPQTFYLSPPTLAASRFFAATNEIRGSLSAGAFMTTGGLFVPSRSGGRVDDGPAVLVARPEMVRLQPDDRPGTTMEVRVVAARFAGTHLVVTVLTDQGQPITVHHPVDAPLTLGTHSWLRLPSDAPVFSVP